MYLCKDTAFSPQCGALAAVFTFFNYVGARESACHHARRQGGAPAF